MCVSTVVIGAGPAGLTVSAELMRRGRSVICLESAARAGGMISSRHEQGFLAESGPHSLRIRGDRLPEAFTLAGVEDQLVVADTRARKRFVTSHGRPTAVPSGPGSALVTPLLRARGKARLLMEPFVAAGEDRDESLASFARRRLGKEVLENLLDAVVGGIFAGDPEQLAVRHAFPALYAMEQKHGSLILGGMRGRNQNSGGKPRIVSFRGGMRTLTDGLARRLGDALKLSARVTDIRREATGYTVTYHDAEGRSHTQHATELIIATPPHRWRELKLPEEFGSLVKFGYERVPNPPVAIVTLGYRRDEVAHPLDGFGVLTPGKENRTALGIVFPSSIFPNRAPDGHVSLAVFIGGMRSPEYARLDDVELVELARNECRSLLGATGEPVFTSVAKQAHAIPQYDRDHGELIARIEAAEQVHPGLHFLGNFRDGISLPATLDNAVALAAKIAAP